MTATTSPSDAPVRLHRFDRAERVAHWANAVLFGVCIATAAALYIGPLSAAVGRRELVRTIHVYTGLALPLPLLVAAAGRWGAGFRRDLRRLNRWTEDDIRWLRSWSRDPLVRAGKFNPGQKLNAAFVGGAIVLMVATGSIMHWFGPFPLSWRTGATFVHDWLAFFLFIVIAGHIIYAFRDGDALRSMVSGSIPATWARSHAPRWYEELVPRPGTLASVPGESGASLARPQPEGIAGRTFEGENAASGAIRPSERRKGFRSRY